MNRRVYSIIEIVLSALLVIVGLFSIISIELLQDFIIWVVIGFFTIRISLALFKYLTFNTSKVYSIVQMSLNAVMIILLIVFRADMTALSYVVLSSCLIDLVTNIIKIISFRKHRDSESFFGIDNIISILFIVLLIANKNNPALAIGVLFGSFIMYKGVIGILSNHYVRKLVSFSDLGRTLNKVHALDIFFGLLIVLMLTSFILPYIEPGITNTGDAWWYCFAVITTIGYGDFTCTTVVGRILSVIIGFYGIIIVSLLTSSLVIYITSENEKSMKEKEKETAKEEIKETSKVEDTPEVKTKSKKNTKVKDK